MPGEHDGVATVSKHGSVSVAQSNSLGEQERLRHDGSRVYFGFQLPAQHYSRPLDGCGSIRSLCPCVQHFRSALAALYVDGFRADGGVGCCYLSRQLARVLEVVTLDTRGAYGSDFGDARNVFRFSRPLGTLARVGGGGG